MHSLFRYIEYRVPACLDHASVQTTEMFLRADPTEKLEALTAMGPPSLKRGRFAVPDKLMAMLADASTGRNYAE
jgi:integrase/recombinase XerD